MLLLVLLPLPSLPLPLLLLLLFPVGGTTALALLVPTAAPLLPCHIALPRLRLAPLSGGSGECAPLLLVLPLLVLRLLVLPLLVLPMLVLGLFWLVSAMLLGATTSVPLLMSPPPPLLLLLLLVGERCHRGLRGTVTSGELGQLLGV